MAGVLANTKAPGAVLSGAGVIIHAGAFGLVAFCVNLAVLAMIEDQTCTVVASNGGEPCLVLGTDVGGAASLLNTLTFLLPLVPVSLIIVARMVWAAPRHTAAQLSLFAGVAVLLCLLPKPTPIPILTALGAVTLLEGAIRLRQGLLPRQTLAGGHSQ